MKRTATNMTTGTVCPRTARASRRAELVSRVSTFYRSKTNMIVAVLCLISGCTTFDLSKRIPWMDTDEVTQPTKITALWTHTILNQSGQKGVRGFGGRIMFHGKENEKPVRVEGTLVVYAFDETTRVNSVPERKFVFTPEQFEKHYSHSKIGHSYSIWLPWDEVGGPPRRINLLARFEPVSGSTVMSENSLQILPGLTPAPYDDASEESKFETSEIQQTGFQRLSTKKSESPSASRQLMNNDDAIDLPPNFMRRLGLQDQEPAVKIQQSTLSSPPLTAPQPVPASEGRGEPEAAKPNPTTGLQTRNSEQATTSQQALADRQQELSDHFGRRKSRVQKALVARSKPVPPPNRLPPADELSLLPRTSTPGSKD